MKIFNLIQWTTAASTCQSCIWFQNDPSVIEATYPGLTSMSSGYASVRDHDGLCGLHKLYLSSRDSCKSYASIEKNLSKSFGK